MIGEFTLQIKRLREFERSDERSNPSAFIGYEARRSLAWGTKMKLKCMLVDDEPYIRLILRRVIEKTEEFEVAAECANASEALSVFAEKKPDVVFMDIDLNGESGIDCAKAMLAL